MLERNILKIPTIAVQLKLYTKRKKKIIGRRQYDTKNRQNTNMLNILRENERESETYPYRPITYHMLG